MFIQSKIPLIQGIDQVWHGLFQDVSQSVAWFNEMVAGIYVTVVFQDQRSAACLLENANAGGQTAPTGQRRIEHLDEHCPHIMLHPFIEDVN